MRRLVSLEFGRQVSRGLVLFCAVLLGSTQLQAQSGDLRDQSKQGNAAPADAAKDSQRKVDEFTEAAQAINGPAGNPECVWLGRRFVGLMKRDDLDTAFRHLDLYDRFGCPGAHIQAAFRCLTRFPDPPKAPDTLNSQVQTCWINPAAQPVTTTAASPVPAPAAAPATPPNAGTAGPPK